MYSHLLTLLLLLIQATGTGVYVEYGSAEMTEVTYRFVSITFTSSALNIMTLWLLVVLDIDIKML